MIHDRRDGHEKQLSANREAGAPCVPDNVIQDTGNNKKTDRPYATSTSNPRKRFNADQANHKYERQNIR
jgi:hypothetical protein